MFFTKKKKSLLRLVLVRILVFQWHVITIKMQIKQYSGVKQLVHFHSNALFELGYCASWLILDVMFKTWFNLSGIYFHKKKKIYKNRHQISVCGGGFRYNILPSIILDPNFKITFLKYLFFNTRKMSLHKPGINFSNFIRIFQNLTFRNISVPLARTTAKIMFVESSKDDYWVNVS